MGDAQVAVRPNEPPVATAGVFIPPHTVIGGADVAAESFKSFVQDMRQISQAAQRNADAWAEIAQTGARRSMDFYTAVAFNNISQDQSGATASQFGTQPGQQGMAARQTTSSPSSMGAQDNANANSTQLGTDAAGSIAAGIANALQASLPGLIAAAIKQAMQNPNPPAVS